MFTRHCAFCHEAYHAERVTSRFCSGRCRIADHREKRRIVRIRLALQAAEATRRERRLRSAQPAGV